MKFQKITPFLWFDNNQALEAAEFYCSVFKNSNVVVKNNKSGSASEAEGKEEVEVKENSVAPVVVEFVLDGMNFMAFNGGPNFHFNEAISFLILCDDQNEVDYLWDTFTTNGGNESDCGWCKDKYGVSWQIVPKQFMEMINTGTPEQTQKVMQSMMTMKKMIVHDLEMAFHS